MKIPGLVTLVILLLAPTAILNENDRHTPGFPTILLDELFDSLELDPRLLEILRGVTESAVAGKLTDEELANAMLRVLNSGAPEEDVVTSLNVLSKFHSLSKAGTPISPDTLYKLLSGIKDEKLLNDLRALIEKYASGLATPQDVESLIKRIETNYASTGIKPIDLIIATEVSQLVGRSIGYNDVGNLVNRLTEALSSDGFLGVNPGVVEESTKLLENIKLFDEVAGDLGSFIPSLGDVGWAIPSAPSIGLPVFSVGFPRVDLSLIAYVAIPVAVVLLCILLAKVVRISDKLSKALSRLTHLRGSPSFKTLTNLAELRTAIKNYWVAVKFIESRYGIAKHPWETHWEYLSRISIDRKKAFEGLTQTYELAKYAQNESKDIDERSELYLRELIGGRQ